MKKLFKIAGFIPYIAILFLNATTDLAHKITIQNTLVKSYDNETLIILSALINAMILLPFILLFSPSGYLSDKFSKVKVVRYSAFASIFLTLMITLSYYQGWFLLAFIMTFLLAIQSAIYSPAKYGMIKEMVGVDDLGRANAVVQSTTIVALLGSSLLFTFFFMISYDLSYAEQSPQTILPDMIYLGWMMVGLTIVETLLTFKLPTLKAQKPDAEFKLFSYISGKYLKENMGRIFKDKNIFRSIVGLSIFMGVGQLMLAAFPAHYKMLTGSDDVLMIQGILALSAVGVVFGSLLAGRLSDHHIELGVVPVGGFGVAVSLFMFASCDTDLMLALASLIFGFFGGFILVALNANIQFFAKEDELGTVLAGNNFIQNIIMTLFLFATMALVQFAFSTLDIFVFAAFIMLITSLWGMKVMPHLVLRVLLLPLLKFRARVKVQGLENLPQDGGVLLLGNHISWIDWLMIQIASPRAIKFVMERNIYKKWYLNWFLRQFDLIPISSGASREAIKMIRERLDNGEVVCLFPEGLISYNGQINVFKRGFEKSMEDTSHPIVPFYMRGLWGSSFSRASDHFKGISKVGRKRDVVIAFGKALPAYSKADEVRSAVVELSELTWNTYIKELKPLQYHWLDKVKSEPKKRAVVDSTGTDITRFKMLVAVLLFVKSLKKRLKHEENIGVLLPASAVGAIINMALFVMGKKPINLNYTLSLEVMQSSLEKAEIQTVLTSSKFMKKLALKGFDFEALLADKALIVEDLGKGFSFLDKVITFLQAKLLPKRIIGLLFFKKVEMTDTATVLFSSGSEGTPKGIELSHTNLLANIKQTAELLNVQKDDVILNSLPIFHSFGLTATTLFPLCEGIAMVSIPDPTDAVAVGKMSFKYKATLMFGTGTFLRLYTKNRKLHPLMLASLRMAIAGAERLKPEIAAGFKEKFNVEVYEGYGATETSPVISVNMPNALAHDDMKEITGMKKGSAGRALPGTLVKIIDPNTYETLLPNEDGMIAICGPQVMKGYYKDELKTKEVLVDIEGKTYYLTGDKGHVDEDGFIFIVDRYSRFAKIGGEMISLGAVEEALEELFKDRLQILVVSVEDERKGEALVLLYKGDMDEASVKVELRESDIIPLMTPSHYFNEEVLPLLASGKTDLKAAKSRAYNLLSL